MARHCVLDGRNLRSLDDVHDSLARGLGFPAYYGRNLDALRDVLIGDLPGPATIVWRDVAESRRLLGRDFTRVEKVLRDAARERPDLLVEFR